MMTLCFYHNWLQQEQMKFSEFISNRVSYMHFSHSDIDAALPVSLVLYGLLIHLNFFSLISMLVEESLFSALC